MYQQLNQVISQMTAAKQMFEVRETDVAGQVLKTWASAPPSLRDLWLSTAAHGDKDYIVYQDERWTYTEAHEEVARIANWLTANGVKQHDRVAIAMRNYPEWMMTYWALTSIGAVSVGVNAWWVAEELKYGLADSEACIIVCDQERLARFAEVREELPNIRGVVAVRTDDVPEWATPWAEVLQAEPAIPEVSIDPEDDACIFYTSGTTGYPKGAQLTHRGCVNNIFTVMFASLSQLTAIALAEGKAPPNPAESDAQPAGIVSTPLFHVTANNAMAHTMTATGGKLIHMYKWDAGEALRIIEAEKITSFSGVPVMTRELINHPDFNSRDTSTLQVLGGGGAPLQPDLTEKVVARAGDTIPAQGYGLTEVCGVATGGYGKFLSDKPMSAGRILPVFDGKVIDADGNELPKGETGEICLRGPQVIKGYLNRPDATAETIVNGWLHTGDIGYFDEDDFIFLVDRAKDMILRGGENVYCSEVEAAIFKHDAVAEAAVFAVPDERLGEEVGVAVQPISEQKLDAAALREFLAGKLAPFKIPRYIWIMDAPLPRNASGKFLKRELKDMLDISDAS